METSEPSSEVGKANSVFVSLIPQNQTKTVRNEYSSFEQSMPRPQGHRNRDPQNYKQDPYDTGMQNPYYGNVPELYNNPANPMVDKTINGQYPDTAHILSERYNEGRLQERYSNTVEQCPVRFQQLMDGSSPTNIPNQNMYDNRIREQFQTQQFGPRFSSLPDQTYIHLTRGQCHNTLRYDAPVNMNEGIVNSMGERRGKPEMEQQGNFQQARQSIPNTETKQNINPRMDYNRLIQEHKPLELFTVPFQEQFNYQQSVRHQFPRGNMSIENSTLAQQYIGQNAARHNEPVFHSNLQTAGIGASAPNTFIEPRLGQNNPIYEPFREPIPFINFRPDAQRYSDMQISPSFFQFPYMQQPISSRLAPTTFCSNYSVLPSTSSAQVFTTPACRPVIFSLEKKSNEAQVQIVRPIAPIHGPYLPGDHVPMRIPNIDLRPTFPLQIPNISTPTPVITASTVMSSCRDSEPTGSANMSQIQVVNPIISQTISTEHQNSTQKTPSSNLKDEAEKTENLAGKEMSDIFFRGKLKKGNPTLDFIGREPYHSFGEQFSFPDSSASKIKLKSKVYPPIVGAKVAAVIIKDEESTSESKQEKVKQSDCNPQHRNKFHYLTGSKQIPLQYAAETLQDEKNLKHILSDRLQQHTVQLTQASSGPNFGKETSLENEKNIIQETFHAVAEMAKTKLEKIHDGCERLTSSDLLEILEISDEKLAVLELMYLKTVTKDSVFLSYDEVEAILCCNPEKPTSLGCGTLNTADFDGCDTQQLQSSSHYPTVTGAQFFVSDNPCSSSPPTKVSLGNFLMSQVGIKQYILQRFSQDLAKYSTYYSESEADSNSASKTSSSSENDISKFHNTPKNDLFCILTPGGVDDEEEFETTEETSETPDDLYHESVSQNCLRIKRL